MIRFGTAGIPIGADGGDAAAGIAYCRKIGLSAMEVEFVHGVNMNEEKARITGEAGKKNDISLSCHAPYYINTCGKTKAILGMSKRHILASAQAAWWLSASVVVFHPGHYMGRPPAECEKLAIATLQECLDKMDEQKIDGVRLGAELTGKKSAYGSLDEIIGLSSHFGLKRLVPVIDYAHYHARHERLKNKEDYLKILEKMENKLGSEAGKRFHCHFSGIAFSDKGERNHLPIASDSPPFAPLAEAFAERGWSGTVICESPLIEKDALALQKIYKIAEKKKKIALVQGSAATGSGTPNTSQA